MFEWLGYLASVLVAISITIKGGLYFRIFNMIGGICFLVYGILIKSIPVVLINIYGSGINTFYIIKILKSKSTAEQSKNIKKDVTNDE